MILFSIERPNLKKEIEIVFQSPMQTAIQATLATYLGPDVEAGNSVIVLLGVGTLTSDPQLVTCGGLPMTLDAEVSGPGDTYCRVYLLDSSPGGVGSGEVEISSPTDFWARWGTIEIKNLKPAPLDLSDTGAFANPGSVTSLVAPSQDNEFLITGICNLSDHTPSEWVAPVGWTMSNVNSQTWNTDTSAAFAYKFGTSTSGLVTATWGALGFDNAGSTLLATYKGL